MFLAAGFSFLCMCALLQARPEPESLVRARPDQHDARRGARPEQHDARVCFKRQRLTKHSQHIPLRQLAALTIAANSLDDDVEGADSYELLLRSHADALNKDLTETAKRSTPYGQLLTNMTIQVDGSDFVWWYVNPFALLYTFCELSSVFCSFLRSAGSFAGGVLRLCLYTDEHTPGNVRRPDNGRRTQCIYWNCMDFPDYVRSRDNGWYLFGVLQTKHVDKIVGGLTTLLNYVVTVFFSAKFNFAVTGMNFPGTDGKGKFHMFGELSAMVQDERAHKSVFELKGSGGWKCCGKCSNVMNTNEDISWNPTLVDYKTATLDQCKPHTDESYFAMVDDLAAKKGVIPPKEFEGLEMAYGLNYEPTGLLFNKALRRFVKPFSILVYDWMHCLWTSSGVGQYQCNAFIRCALSLGKTLKEFDEFAQTVVQPGGVGKIKRTFFRDRYSNSEDGCLKGFAGECMLAVEVLSWYAHTVLEPQGHMKEECVCMHLLAKMLDIYKQQDGAVEYYEELKVTTSQHQQLFVALHPQLAKKKIHYELHCPEDIERLKRNLNCFAPERFHKIVGARSATCFKGGGGMELTITKTLICYMLSCIAAPDYGKPCVAVRACSLPDMGALSMALCGLPFLAVSKPLQHYKALCLLILLFGVCSHVRFRALVTSQSFHLFKNYCFKNGALEILATYAYIECPNVHPDLAIILNDVLGNMLR